MSVFAFGSARHSPGVTTSLLALAAAWPADRQVLVIEADPAGGDLVCYFRLLLEPSLLSLAAAGRSEVTSTDVWEHAQQLPGDSRVSAVVAPVDPRQVRAALATLTRAGLTSVLSGMDADVLVDAGRLDPDSPAVELFAGADVHVLVGRPTLNQADHLQLRAALLASQDVTPLYLLVVGEGPWSGEELTRGIGAAGLLGVLPEDAHGAAAITAQGRGIRGLRRSALWRSARRIAADLATASATAGSVDAHDPSLQVAPADAPLHDVLEAEDPQPVPSRRGRTMARRPG